MTITAVTFCKYVYIYTIYENGPAAAASGTENAKRPHERVLFSSRHRSRRADVHGGVLFLFFDFVLEILILKKAQKNALACPRGQPEDHFYDLGLACPRGQARDYIFTYKIPSPVPEDRRGYLLYIIIIKKYDSLSNLW